MEPIVEYFSNIPRAKLISRLIMILLSTIILVAVSYFAWDYLINQKTVTLNPSPNTTITIGEQKGDEPVISKQIISTAVKKTVRLRVGTYAVKYSASKDYEEQLTSITIDSSTQITTPTLNYTNNKLASILSGEKSEIQKVIFSIISNKKYNIDKEKLFYTGEWYGARLIPNDWYDPSSPSDLVPRPTNPNNKLDILRVILKKEGESWKLIAGPSIVLYINDYPKIPQDIVRAINKLGFD